MREQRMSLLTAPGIRCIPTNGMVRADGTAVMGSGLALSAANLEPRLPALLGEYIQAYGNRTFNLGGGWVAAPTKDHWRDPSTLDRIEETCWELVDMADKFGWDDIYVSRMGCGLGGLTWSVVKTVISPMLDDRFTATFL